MVETYKKKRKQCENLKKYSEQWYFKCDPFTRL